MLATRTLDQIDPNDVALFVLPGGDRWEAEPPEPELVAALERLDDQRVPVAAICAATVAITRAGLLRGRQHTSNGLAYLREQVTDYSDAARYVDTPAVRDRGLITANGLADIEFAREIFAELDVFSDSDRLVWADMFRSGRMPPDLP